MSFVIIKWCLQNLPAQPKRVNIFSTPMLSSPFEVQKSRKPRIYLVMPSTLYAPSAFLSPVPRNIFSGEISRPIVTLIASNDKRQKKEEKKDALSTSMMRGLSRYVFFPLLLLLLVYTFLRFPMATAMWKTRTQKTRGETQVLR